ncbi:EamA family transporter RarD [Pseudaeromonas sp. ZJS20]|uniref:EamA family transporter RarD n=1 Tax=Pseudaeromonas aegiceratis TaxID=3153928 RepID=UPI00390CD12E
MAGVSVSLMGSLLFAFLYFYTGWLRPLSGEAIYGWRVLLTFPFLTLLLLVRGRWGQVVQIARRLALGGWRSGLWLLSSAAMLGVQLWLFLWAPVNGQGLAVSLGYFLLPLTLVLTGRLLFADPVSRPQWLACGLALLGVGHALLGAGALAWPTWLVCLGYPVYFAQRRWRAIPSLGGLWWDLLLSLPVALWFALEHSPLELWQGGRLAWLILGLGFISAVALSCMMLAGERLSLPLFGLLSYVEPVLLVVAALLLGESLSAEQWWTYGPIWLAVALLGGEGVWRLMARRRPGAAPGSAAQ